MAPPPPPPPSSDDVTMGLHPALLVTPPQKHKTHSYNYNAYGRDRRGTAYSSPATSHASSSASPAQQMLKARSAAEVLSPRLRGTRMDPYPRYSPRKRLSADFSDGTYSADSGADSPKSEKGGWRIHAAVAGPFLTGPLASDFTARLDELRSPRGKKADEPDFDQSGLLLFPVVPDFVAPAITPEVFQASIQPTPVVQTQPQPEPDYSSVTPSNEACYYPTNTDQYYAQQPTTDAVADASWDATAQMHQQQSQESYYYGEQQQQYSAEQYSGEQQQYSAEQYYYNNGYEQYDNAAYTNGEYNYQQNYEQYPAVVEQPAAEVAETMSVEAFPPLPSQSVATPEVDAPAPSATEDAAASNQVAEVNEPTTVPGSPVRRQRAPSYAEIVTGAAHTTPSVTEPEAPKVEEAPKKAAAKANFATFDQLSDGIAESMSRILAKSNGNKTHAEVEFSCLVHRIQTQLKLMGRVSNSLHLKQMKTMHKLQQSEIAKLAIESSNTELLTRVKKYEQEQEELKQQLAEALAAKDVRLKDAVDQLSSKIDSLKNSTDASTSTLASEIDAIRKCSSPDDLEKRVEEIGQVLDFLIENQSEASSKGDAAPPKRASSKFEARRHSVGSWKAIALYAIVVWAASLCGVWVGVKYAGTINPTPVATHPVVQQPAVVEVPAVVETVPVVDSMPAVFEEVSAPVVEVMEAEVREVAVEIEQPASIDFMESIIEPVVANEVEADAEAVEEAAIEVVAPVEAVEEAQVPIQAAVSEIEPSVVFAFEQVARSSPSCFTCPSDHSTMASFFCEMLSEVMSGNSIVESIDEVVVAPTAEAAADVVVDTVESVSVSDNWNSLAVPVEDVEEEMVAEEVAAPTEPIVEAVVEEPATTDVVESVATFQTTERQSVPNVMSSPLAHALYVWCPSLFDMHPEENDAASGPLSDLARALTSLSSQILSDHAPSTIEEVVEESDVATFEVIEEIDEPAVQRTEDVPVAVEVEVVDEVVEVNTEVEAVEDITDVAATEVVEDVVEVALIEEPTVVDTTAQEIVEVEAEAEVASNRWATEQFLINIGAMSGTAEIAAPTVSVNTVEAEEAVEEWSLLEQMPVEEETKFVNSSSVEVVPALPVAEITEVVEITPVEVVVAAEETMPATVEAVAAVEQVTSSCPLERCPLFEVAVAEESKFANASVSVVQPTFQIVEDSAATDEEISEKFGFSPAMDLKSVLLNSL